MSFLKIIGTSFVLSIFVFTGVVLSGAVEGVNVEAIEDLIMSVDVDINEYSSTIDEQPIEEVEVSTEAVRLPSDMINSYTDDSGNFSISLPSEVSISLNELDGGMGVDFELDEQNYIFLEIYPYDTNLDNDFMLTVNEDLRLDATEYAGTLDESVYSDYIDGNIVYSIRVDDINDEKGYTLTEYIWNIENNLYVMSVECGEENQAYFDAILDQITLRNFDMLVMKW